MLDKKNYTNPAPDDSVASGFGAPCEAYRKPMSGGSRISGLQIGFIAETCSKPLAGAPWKRQESTMAFLSKPTGEL